MSTLRTHTTATEKLAHRSPGLTVIGAGAVGGLLTAMLARKGEPVTVVAREATEIHVRESGLTIISGLLGTWTSWPKVFSTPKPDTTVLLAVKASGLTETIAVLKEVQPFQVIPVLNGIQHLATLREALPRTQVVPATITVEAERIGPTVIEHRSPFVRLTVTSTFISDPAFASLTRAGVEVVPGGSEAEVVWRKYRFLAPMALLTAFYQCPVRAALETDPALTASVLHEVAEVTSAAGLPTGPEELRAILDSLPGSMRSSLQLDMASGRPNELEAIGGGLLEAGDDYSVPVPASSQLVKTLRARV